MATYCPICKNKISLLEQSFIIDSKKYSKNMCQTCAAKSAILRGRTDGDRDDALRYFNNHLNNTIDNDTLKGIISEWIEEIDRKKNKELIAQKLKYFPMTTSFNFEGYSLTDYLGVVSGESFLGTGLKVDASAFLAEAFGTESKKLNEKLKEARESACRTMIFEAYSLGANSIIGVKHDYFQLSGEILAVSISGTAVTRVPTELK